MRALVPEGHDAPHAIKIAYSQESSGHHTAHSRCWKVESSRVFAVHMLPLKLDDN